MAKLEKRAFISEKNQKVLDIYEPYLKKWEELIIEYQDEKDIGFYKELKKELNDVVEMIKYHNFTTQNNSAKNKIARHLERYQLKKGHTTNIDTVIQMDLVKIYIEIDKL